MNLDFESALAAAPATPRQPVLLFAKGDHRIYWIGISDETAFHCNTYLILDTDQALLVDPGSRDYFQQVRDRVAAIVPPERITGLIIGHQDPDVAACLPDWLAVNPDLTVYTSPRTEVLLPHYGVSGYRRYDVEAQPVLTLAGGELRFVGAPFLHSPMAFATFDSASGLLFTGDVFAAVDSDWRLVVEDFEQHAARMDLFHLDYMASGVAAKGFARRMRELPLRGILPQHGSLIPPSMVEDAIDYLEQIQCGLDLIYPDLT